MTRVLQPTNPTQFPVAPGVPVVAQLPMAAAVNAGDYIYLTASGYGAAPATTSFNQLTTYIATASQSTFLQTNTTPGCQFGPVHTQTTYSGATKTLGQNLTAAVQVNATADTNIGRYFTVLSNNNFVVIYRTSANNYSFKILNSAGTTVVAATSIASNIRDNSNRVIAVTPLRAGGFVILYCITSGTNFTAKKYANDGTLINTYTFAGPSAMSNMINISIAEGVTGNFMVVTSANTAMQYNWYDSSFTVLTAGWGTITGQASSSVFAIGRTDGGWAFMYTTGPSGLAIAFFTSAFVQISSSYSLSISTSVTNACTATTSSDAGVYVCFAEQTTNNLKIYKVNLNTAGTGITSTTATLATGVALASSTTPPIITPSINNDFAVMFCNISSAWQIIFANSSLVATSSVVAVNGTTAAVLNSYSSGFTCTSDGIIGFLTNEVTTNYPVFLAMSAIAFTNGQTLTSRLFSPTTGYFLAGISLNSASAGQTANVVINGQANLNSNYPSLTTTVQFDFSQTSSFGNSGSVYGRAVTLRGLQ